MHSMTGFGRATQQTNLGTVSVEIRGVNNRYLDISLRTTREFSFVDEHIKELVKEHVSRGRVDISLRVQGDQLARDTARIDVVKASQYHAVLKGLVDELQLVGTVSLDHIITMPGVLVEAPMEIDEAAAVDKIKPVVREALLAFSESRQREGLSLVKDMRGRLAAIALQVGNIEKQTETIVDAQRKRLRDNIERLIPDLPVDSHRLELEVALFADRASVAEELVRLRTHLSNFASFLASTEAVGRKMDFYLQEMNREINTIGSKVPDALVSQYVVEIKAELEKIREQAQNME